MNEDLVTRFGRQVRDDPSRPALIEVSHRDGRAATGTATYGELHDGARAIAGWLRAHAVPGDRVLLLYPSSIDFAKAFWGCLYAGCVPVPAPLPGTFGHHLSLTTGIALDAGPRLVLTDTEHLDGVADWLIQDRLNELALFATDLVDLSRVQAAGPIEVHGSSPAFVQYTSTGTDLAGHSISHAGLARDIEMLDNTLDLAAHGTIGGWLPMHHNLGLVGLLLAPLAVGATSVLMSPTEFLKHPQRWLQLIDTFDIRLTAAPNFAYDHCVRRISAEVASIFDLSRLRTAVNGPEPVSAATLTAFAERFAPSGLNPRALTPAYGPADGARLITVSPPGDRIDGPLVTPADRWALERDTLQPAAGGLDLVSCGPVEGTGLQVFNSATQTELLDGLVGEIWLDGYAPTGDLGVIHGGQLYRTGRVNDRLAIDGRSLYAHDIEQELSQLEPAFADLPGCVCAVDVPREELVVLQEVPARTSNGDLTALATAVRDALRDRYRVRVANVVFLRPGQIHRVAGRVQRTLMRELFRSDALAPVYEVLGRQTRQRFRFTEPLPAPAVPARRRNAAVPAVAAQ